MISIPSKTTPPLSKGNLGSLNSKHGQPLTKDTISRLNMKNTGNTGGTTRVNTVPARPISAQQNNSGSRPSPQGTRIPVQQTQRSPAPAPQPTVQKLPDIAVPNMQHLLRKGQKTSLSPQGQNIFKVKA